jgi:hypothetical protein
MSRVSDLVDQLMGTCNSIGDEADDFTSEELLEFDSLIFECEGCNWWFETGEMGADGLCDSCADLAEEEERKYGE